MNKQYSHTDKIKHRTEGYEKYPAWSQLASLQLVNKESEFSAVYKLSYCLFVDMNKFEHYLKYLRWWYFGGYKCQDRIARWSLVVDFF